jgi:histone acetyltransferase MYST1
LYYDVEPFVFYVLCELDDQGAKMVGYFSKEKESPDQNNLACIMVMPPFQRQGYGKFIIDLSYKLSLRQKLIGGPERPLSDLGKVSYRSYWEYTLLSAYKNLKMPTLKELVNNTGIGEVDTIETLKRLNLVTFWRGDYVLRNPLSTIDLAANSFKQPRVLVKEEFLIWRGDKKLKN